MHEAIEIIKTVGFPIFVCLWFMLRLERKLDRVRLSVTKLVLMNSVLVKTLDIAEEELPELELPEADGG